MAERALLVGLEVGRSSAGREGFSAQSSLDELARLAHTASAKVVGSELQRRPRHDPATLIGRGKAQEIRERCANEGIHTVIFDEPLTAAQQHNLEGIINAKIVDRTGLILDIFARRAHSREGILQVELAKLSYLLPRLAGHGAAFSQQTGGIGTFRGPGERKIEYDRRRIRDRISLLKKRLAEVQRQRSMRRTDRHDVPLPVVALVGYTNAGKSTLLNSLVSYSQKAARPSVGIPTGGGPAYADDKLFATLDPMTRRGKLPDGRWALFTDTVGFIQKLPHELVAAFRATLEEVKDADLLVHVIDVTSPHRAAQERAVEKVLGELGVGESPMLRVFNKSDLLDQPARRMADGIWISALTGVGLDEMLNRVGESLSRGLKEEEIFIPYEKSGLLGRISGIGVVSDRVAVTGGYRVRMKLDPKHMSWLKRQMDAKT